MDKWINTICSSTGKTKNSNNDNIPQIIMYIKYWLLQTLILALNIFLLKRRGGGIPKENH